MIWKDLKYLFVWFWIDAESEEVHPTSTSESVSASVGASTTSALSNPTAIPISIAASTCSSSSTDSIPTSVKRKKENTNRDIADSYPHLKKCLKTTNVEPDSSRSQKIAAKPENSSEGLFTSQVYCCSQLLITQKKNVVVFLFRKSSFIEIGDNGIETWKSGCFPRNFRSQDRIKRLVHEVFENIYKTLKN